MVGIVSVRQQRVVAVTAQAVVEGHNEWLGGSWYLYETIPDYEIKQLRNPPGCSLASEGLLPGWMAR